MPFSKFRLYAVTIHDATTRQAIVPEFEVMILKAAWRGKKIVVEPTNDTMDLPMDGPSMWSSLMARYATRFVEMCFSGPERLERDMQMSLEKTDKWLADCAAHKAREDERIRQITPPKNPDPPVQKKAG